MKQETSLSDKIKEAQSLKLSGNQHFKRGELVKSLRCYHQANLYISGIIDKQSPMAMYSKEHINEQQKHEINQLKFTIYMNMAQVYLKQQKFQKSLQKLDEASQIKQTTKLKYRKALAYYHLKDFEKASDLFASVIKQDSSMYDDIQPYIKTIKEQQKKSDQKSKNMFKKFFSGPQQ